MLLIAQSWMANWGFREYLSSALIGYGADVAGDKVGLACACGAPKAAAGPAFAESDMACAKPKLVR
jgi:hypothetical protein